MSRGLGVAVAVLLLALAGSCAMASAGDSGPPETPPEVCDRPPVQYRADSICRPGGETVEVAHVVDGDTLKLADGREIQVIGIDAPELADCGGESAADFVRREVEGDEVQLYEEPGVSVDRVGRPLRYVRFHGREFIRDLAQQMMDRGLVWRFPTYAGNGPYTVDLQTAYESAADIGRGIYGPPCTPYEAPAYTPPETDPAETGASEGAEVDVDVDVDGANRPEGSSTFGYCARKWWC